MSLAPLLPHFPFPPCPSHPFPSPTFPLLSFKTPFLLYAYTNHSLLSITLSLQPCQHSEYAMKITLKRHRDYAPHLHSPLLLPPTRHNKQPRQSEPAVLSFIDLLTVRESNVFKCTKMGVARLARARDKHRRLGRDRRRTIHHYPTKKGPTRETWEIRRNEIARLPRWTRGPHPGAFYSAPQVEAEAAFGDGGGRWFVLMGLRSGVDDTRKPVPGPRRRRVGADHREAGTLLLSRSDDPSYGENPFSRRLDAIRVWCSSRQAGAPVEAEDARLTSAPPRVCSF